MLPNSSRFSGTRPRPRDTITSTSGTASRLPSKATRPREPSTPMMAESRVVLPAPLGPITVTICPWPTVRLALDKASTLP
ncbi:hypothetical protein D3C80_403870 [compost metagenome]